MKNLLLLFKKKNLGYCQIGRCSKDFSPCKVYSVCIFYILTNRKFSKITTSDRPTTNRQFHRAFEQVQPSNENFNLQLFKYFPFNVCKTDWNKIPL